MDESLPVMPKASDYQGDALKRFRAGRAAAKRYYASPVGDYCGYIERADARDEPQSWYDGWDSVCNPSYFA